MTTHRSRRAAAGLLVWTALGGPAGAHDTWLVADRQTAGEGETVRLTFATGEVFPNNDAAIDRSRVAEFVVARGERTDRLADYVADERGVRAERTLAAVGVHVFGCVLRPRLIELEPAQFEEYLRGERADAAMTAWANLDQRPVVAVERYTKYGKTIVQAGPADPADRRYEQPLGHRLEIIPLSNPCHWSAGDEASVRVLLDGHAWADVPVSAGHDGLAAHAYPVQTRTNAEGVAAFKVTRPGHWFIKAHLIRPTSGLERCQWESFWTSLTFRAGGTTDTGDMLAAVRAVHGRDRPAAVAGYRMGRRALEELGLERGAETLHVIIFTPPHPRFAAVADGIQAATGATVGRANLTVKEAAPQTYRAVFVRGDDGRSVTCIPRGSFVAAMIGESDDAAEEKASMTGRMKDDAIFEVTVETGDSPGGDDAAGSPPAPDVKADRGSGG